jgi:hypothetical protein
MKEDAVGGTPTAAVGTTALPMKSLMIGDNDRAGIFRLRHQIFRETIFVEYPIKP